jgi:ABC-type molybdate transport system permease subunit
MGGALIQTHTTLEFSLPPLVLFYLFSLVWSKASFIGELEHLKESWYDQYEEFFYVLVLIISI